MSSPQLQMPHYRRSIDYDIEVSTAFGNHIEAWFARETDCEKLRAWLTKNDTLMLAHADDGVIWGRTEQGLLTTSHTVIPQFSPELRAVTLQQCRLFNSHGELLIWRYEDHFRVRWVQDQEQEDGAVEAFDEAQMLWGTYRHNTLNRDGFTVVYEGQGLYHAVPLSPDILHEHLFGTEQDERKRKRPLRLIVRHYIDYDAYDCARVTLSRLVGLSFVTLA